MVIANEQRRVVMIGVVSLSCIGWMLLLYSQMLANILGSIGGNTAYQFGPHAEIVFASVIEVIIIVVSAVLIALFVVSLYRCCDWHRRHVYTVVIVIGWAVAVFLSPATTPVRVLMVWLFGWPLIL